MFWIWRWFGFCVLRTGLLIRPYTASTCPRHLAASSLTVSTPDSVACRGYLCRYFAPDLFSPDPIIIPLHYPGSGVFEALLSRGAAEICTSLIAVRHDTQTWKHGRPFIASFRHPLSILSIHPAGPMRVCVSHIEDIEWWVLSKKSPPLRLRVAAAIK